ncbi:MAG: tRNA (adenosine(37)-N6)-dimethylallyltransferase MiaA [bacterium]|nr:tRNA (adenosine(37)-N6)-dimethylallyltransferase MiaA [bacterium]
MSKKIIQILGPTGVGKSSAAVQLAKEIDGEIISADSVQVYKHFDIGTAKVTPKEEQGIPHYLIDIYSDCTQFNTSIFLEKSFAVSEGITGRGKVPIVCGGTALYLKCMITGIFPESKEKRVSREKLDRVVENRGLPYLWNRLNKVDPRYAQKIGSNDRVRIVRAMEIYYNNGIPPSEIFRHTRTPFHEYTFIRVGLNFGREELYRRIEARVDRMMERGLLEEVTRLREKYPPGCPPFKSLGYKEMWMYLAGEVCLEEAVALTKQHSRNFAKRQLSWFRQENDIRWFNPRHFDNITAFVREQL